MANEIIEAINQAAAKLKQLEEDMKIYYIKDKNQEIGKYMLMKKDTVGNKYPIVVVNDNEFDKFKEVLEAKGTILLDYRDSPPQFFKPLEFIPESPPSNLFQIYNIL